MNAKRGLVAAAIALTCVAAGASARAATAGKPPATVSARQLFDEGNALLSRGDAGHAIVAFERARVLSPAPAIVVALDRARAQAGLAPEPTPPVWAPARVPLPWRTVGAAALFALFWAGLIVWRRAGRAVGWWRAATLACGLAGLATAASVGWDVAALRHAAIVTAATPAQVSPFSGAASEGAFRPGERVRMLGRFGDFVHVSDGAGRTGWVESARVESITT
jgi:hypothetical protein